MGIFKTKDYSKCLADITAVFSKTISQSEQLIADMEEEINANKKAIETLYARNETIEQTNTKTKTFIENLNKLLQ